MALTNKKALEILGLPIGSDITAISTRYKQLAIKWHPEKHKHSKESQQKFKQVTLAFRRLASQDSKDDLSMNDCLSLFQQIVFNRAAANGNVDNDSDSSDNSDDDDSDDSDNQMKQHNGTNSIGREGGSNITEEERERKKAEKRRLKKKRQRERKRLEKEQNSHNTEQQSSNKKDKKQPNISGKNPKQNSSSEDDNAFDPTSAFFTKVVSKKKQRNTILVDVNPGGKRDKSQEKNSDEEEEAVDPTVLRSRQLAIRGNEMAQVDQYTAAIQLFTEAISLDPSDFRFFGNRSYCYDRIEHYEKALRDAEKAIKLDKDWPKGYFRKGRALAGLKKFVDAEKSFMQVLKLDKNCDDAVTELAKVRAYQLMDMGFSQSQSEAAIKKYNSVQSALDSLLAGVGIGDSTVNDLYISGDEDEGFSVHRPAPIPPPSSNPTDVKMDPTNPEGLTALWVGNVLPSVTEKRLNQLFSKFGQVTSVRPLPEKYCAFVNFKTKEAAGRAMHQLQGTEVDGQKLLIKFPDNPLTSNAAAAGTITLRKNLTNGANKGVRNTPKMSGPVNGDECYFWRTTGCTFGSDCKWQHYPKSKGIDRKPWQK